jgi:hypothetical protein
MVQQVQLRFINGQVLKINKRKMQLQVEIGLMRY